MKQNISRRLFLRNTAFAGSLVILPGGFSKLTGMNQSSSQPVLTDQPVTWFSASGETIYHVKAGKSSAEISRSIYAAAFSGKVLCFDFSGTKLWEYSNCKDFPFAMDVADIDGDGFDECVIVSADGSLYIIDHDGKEIAKLFTGKPPLYAVRIVTDSQGNQAIYCGGIERILYKVSTSGVLLAQNTTTAVIRNIEPALFSKTEGIVLVVALNANYVTCHLSFYTLPNFKIKGSVINTKESGLFNLRSHDIDSDGLDSIIYGNDAGGIIFDSAGKKVSTLQEKNTGKGQDAYSMVLLDKIPSTSGNAAQLIGQFGPALRFYTAEGTIQKEVLFDISPAGFSFDQTTRTLLYGSEMSGGDTIYCVKVDAAGWENALKTLGYRGKIAQVISNITTLTAQINAYKAPEYQPKELPEINSVFTFNPFNPGTVAEIAPSFALSPLTTLFKTEFKYAHMNFSGNQWISENYDRTTQPYGWDKKRDPRMTYLLTQKEIIDHARKLEQDGLPFTWTIGHGNDPFFLQLSTVEGILTAAPNACKGFIIPELSVEDTPAFHYAVDQHIRPICDLCAKYGNRKMFLRSKFFFWVADCYTDLWSWMLKDKKYKDVIVPSMEETNQRVCDLSLSSRLGLQKGGWFTDWAGRAVHDNVNYNRSHQWVTTMVGSHFLRALCYSATLGARYNLIQLSESGVSGGKGIFRDHSFVVLPYLHMLGKGILPCPQNQSDKLSVSPVAIGMRKPTKAFTDAVQNGHEVATYQGDLKWVFSRAECFWAQAPTPTYDFGYYGVGRRRQALNFVPKNPYGIVPIVPGDDSPEKTPGIEKVMLTDGIVWYDDQKASKTAENYAAQVEKTLKDESEKMLVKVVGDVAWTATRLDNSHIRLVLIDPGYLDPADHDAQITMAVPILSATDILSKTSIAVNHNTIQVTVPMGILRVIDLQTDDQTSFNEPSEQKFKIYPNPVTDNLNIQLTDQTAEWEVEVFDMSGKMLIQEQNSTTISTYSLGEGTYIVNIKSGIHRFVQKIIKV